jgi:hypothetical protein
MVDVGTQTATNLQIRFYFCTHEYGIPYSNYYWLLVFVLLTPEFLLETFLLHLCVVSFDFVFL